MAKFCGNCGAQMDDDAAVCGYCGATLENGSAGKAQAFKVDDPEKKKKTKKYVAIGASVAAVIVVISILGSIISNNTGYKGCLKKTMKAIEKSDMNSLNKIYTDIYSDLDGDEEDYYIEVLEKRAEHIDDALVDKVGHNYKFSYDVDQYYTLEGRKYDQIIDELEDMDIDTSSISKIKVAEVVITAKKGNKSRDYEVTIKMVKENGSWKLLSIEPEDYSYYGYDYDY